MCARHWMLLMGAETGLITKETRAMGLHGKSLWHKGTEEAFIVFIGKWKRKVYIHCLFYDGGWDM